MLQSSFYLHGHTMGMFSDEPIETCHGQLRFMERREDTIIGAMGVWLVNIRVRDQRQALICGTCEAFSLWLRQEIKMESQAIGKIYTMNF